MTPDDPAGTRPAPVVLRIKLRYETVDEMTERFAPNVGRSGLFLPTRSMQPLGTEVKFELRLASDQPVLVGLGRVKSVREPDPAQPDDGNARFGGFWHAAVPRWFHFDRDPGGCLSLGITAWPRCQSVGKG